MRRSARPALLLLLALHLALAGAGFLSPYDVTAQHRDLPLAPPTPLRWVEPGGRFHLRPFVYRLLPREGTFGAYDEDRSRPFPVRFFARGRLFAVDEPATLFLLGSDRFGRDQFSRLLHGGRTSLLAGLGAASLTLGLGLLLGGLAGFYGRALDALVARTAELFLALPWLYLLFAVRAFLPLDAEPRLAYLALIALLGAAGWARPALLVRAVVRGARSSDHVRAARALGASDLRLLGRHVLPQARGVLLTQASLLVPQYVLAEVTLSFLGLGLAEPLPSWGNMLAGVQRLDVLASSWWMLAPALALIPFCLLYYALADELQKTV